MYACCKLLNVYNFPKCSGSFSFFFFFFFFFFLFFFFFFLSWDFTVPVNTIGSCRARPAYLTTLLLGRLCPLSGQPVSVHIISPETDNCPSWISGRDRLTEENISWSISTKECCRNWRGSDPRSPDHQSDAHPTEPPRLACSGLHSLPSTQQFWDTPKECKMNMFDLMLL